MMGNAYTAKKRRKMATSIFNYLIFSSTHREGLYCIKQQRFRLYLTFLRYQCLMRCLKNVCKGYERGTNWHKSVFPRVFGSTESYFLAN